MKRSLSALGLFFSAAFASGCPVYHDNVVSPECVYATDCPIGYGCTSGGVCVPSPPHGGTGGNGDAVEAGTDVAPTDAAEDADPVDGSRPDDSTDAPPTDDAAPAVFCGNPND